MGYPCVIMYNDNTILLISIRRHESYKNHINRKRCKYITSQKLYSLHHLHHLHHHLHIMDIWIRIPRTNHWTSSVTHVTPGIRGAYVEYKERPNYYRETPYLTTEYIVYRPDNDPYLPTYTARIEDIPALNDGTGVGNGIGVGQRNNLANNITISQAIHDTMEHTGKAIPIMDMNDVSVFIVDNPGMGRANWLLARSYQAWAYRDFVYDHHKSVKKSYMSRGTFYLSNDDHILTNQIVTMQVDNIAPNIVFNISRNDNNSVYFERNDEYRTRVRICDNEYARSGYLGFYTRLTMDPGIIVIPPPLAQQNGGGGGGGASLLSTSHLPAPEETDDEQHQCILCFKYRINAKFSPCEHKVCCSSCYSKMSKNECPVCRAEITRIMNV